MWKLDYIESWVLKNWCFWTVMLEKTLESPLDCKKIQPVHPKGGQSLIFIERTDAKVETPKLWPRNSKSWLIGKDSDAGKDWRQEEKGTTEDEMFGGHHWLNGHVWVSSGSWWWTGRPGVLPSMGLQRVRHDWATELNRTFFKWRIPKWFFSEQIYDIRQFFFSSFAVSMHIRCFSPVQLFVTLWNIVHQTPLPMGFSRQEYWVGLPFPTPGDLPNPGIKPGSPALQAASLPSEPLLLCSWPLVCHYL